MKIGYVVPALVLLLAFSGCVEQEGETMSAAQETVKEALVAAGTKGSLAEAREPEAASLLVDDFEGEVSAGLDGTFDYGAGGGAQVEISASGEIKKSGDQSLKVIYDAPADGYMWIARGFDLDAARTDWSVKYDEIDWSRYAAFSFFVHGTASGAQIAFDIKDSGNEMWRFMFTDDMQGWKQVTADFSAFFVRDDWQPDDADTNAELDFPVKSFQFEPRPISKGTLYFDGVQLIKK